MIRESIRVIAHLALQGRLGKTAAALLFLSAAAASAQTVPYAFGRQNTYTFPYSMLGRVEYLKGSAGYHGSGAIIRPQSVLTCSHVLYDPNTGWSSNVKYARGAYGNTWLQRSRAATLYTLGGYQENARAYGGADYRAFQYDLGGMTFSNFPGRGGSTGWGQNPSVLTTPGYYKAAFGYGGDEHNGKLLLKLEVYSTYYQSLGGYYLTSAAHSEHGMSGGPLMTQYPDGSFRPIAVIVSGNASGEGYYRSGIHAIDDDAVRLIQQNFR